MRVWESSSYLFFTPCGANVETRFNLQPEKVAFELKLGQSKPIYNAFKTIQDSPGWDSLSDAGKRIVECKPLNSSSFLQSIYT